MSYDEYDNISRIESLDVVAINGEGIYLVDDSDRCWRVCSHQTLVERDDGLAQAYEDAR